MNKIIAIILFASTVLFICCYAAIDRYHKTLGDSHCFTIKETYNIFNDDELVINIYDNEKDSLINYATNAEAKKLLCENMV